MSREIIYTDDFIRSAADRILQRMADVLRHKHFCGLSLCGGSTPFPVYERIAREGSEIPWIRVIITFGDERCVPPDDAQSNFRAAKERFLKHVSIPESNILRIKGEAPPEAAALDYEGQLDSIAKKLKVHSFIHDLLLLGVGDDGHTASLFPDTAALGVVDRRVVANYVPKLKAHRITFTLPYINQSSEVMFLVDDPQKRQVVDAVISGKSTYPSGKVKPDTGNLIWILGGLI